MRIAIVSDVHEDVVSLKKVLRRIDRCGYDRLVCLGDISGFSLPFYKYGKTRDASACLSLLRGRGALIVPGNHDYSAAQRVPVCVGSHRLPKNWYQMTFEQQVELTEGKIWLHKDDLEPGYSDEEIAYLRSLPEFEVMDVGEYRVLFSHYAYPNLAGFEKGFYAWEADFKEHFKFMDENNCGVSFTGHAHSRGFYLVRPQSFRHYSYRSVYLKDEPLCVGIPPVTSHRIRRGFCMLDSERGSIRAKRVL